MAIARGARQFGQETLQAILAVCFMLVPLLFGMIEFGGLIHVWIAQQSAATIGARVAGERGEDDATVRARILVALQASGLNATGVELRVTPSFVHWGQAITVEVRSHRRIAIPFLFSRDVILSSAAVGRGEMDH